MPDALDDAYNEPLMEASRNALAALGAWLFVRLVSWWRWNRCASKIKDWMR